MNNEMNSSRVVCRRRVILGKTTNRITPATKATRCLGETRGFPAPPHGDFGIVACSTDSQGSGLFCQATSKEEIYTIRLAQFLQMRTGWM